MATSTAPRTGRKSWTKPRRVVAFYNHRGTPSSGFKEGKNAMVWTRLSCRGFIANAVRLQLHTLAYNLANFMRTLALPQVGEAVVTDDAARQARQDRRQGRYVTQLAEVAVPRTLFAQILRLIDQLRPKPAPT